MAPTTTGLRSLNGFIRGSHLSEPVLYFTGIETSRGRFTRPWNSQR